MADDLFLAIHGKHIVQLGKAMLAASPFLLALGYFGWNSNLDEVGVVGPSGVTERFVALGLLQAGLLLANLVVLVLVLLLKRRRRFSMLKAGLMATFGGGTVWVLYLQLLKSWVGIPAGFWNFFEAFLIGFFFVPVTWGLIAFGEWAFQQLSEEYRKVTANPNVVFMTIPTFIALLSVAVLFPLAFGDDVPVAYGGTRPIPAVVQVVPGTNVSGLPVDAIVLVDEIPLADHLDVVIVYFDDDSLFLRAKHELSPDGWVAVGPLIELSRGSVVAIRWNPD